MSADSDLAVLMRVIDALRREPDAPAPAVQLSTRDFDWLADLLLALAAGHDVRERIHGVAKGGAPRKDGHAIFVALDVELRYIAAGRPARQKKRFIGAVAEDWGIPDRTVRDFCTLSRDAVTGILRSDHAGLARVVAWHRAEFVTRNPR